MSSDRSSSGANDRERRRVQALGTQVDWREAFGALYDAVDKAEKLDTNSGDSAVSVALWSYAEIRRLI